MHEYACKLRDAADAVARETGWSRPNGYGLGPVMRHRDSDVLTNSNFEVILADLQSIDDRVDSISFGHFAVGWVEEIMVPLTGAVCDAVQGWVDALADYPVASDDDYNEREHADAIETLENCYGLSGDMAERIFTYLSEHDGDCRGDDYTTNSVAEAKSAVHAEILDELGLDDDERHAAAVEILAGVDVLFIGRPDETMTLVVERIKRDMMDRGMTPQSVAVDADGRIVVVLDWRDASKLSA